MKCKLIRLEFMIVPSTCKRIFYEFHFWNHYLESQLSIQYIYRYHLQVDPKEESKCLFQ